MANRCPFSQAAVPTYVVLDEKAIIWSAVRRRVCKHRPSVPLGPRHVIRIFSGCGDDIVFIDKRFALIVVALLQRDLAQQLVHEQPVVPFRTAALVVGKTYQAERA